MTVACNLSNLLDKIYVKVYDSIMKDLRLDNLKGGIEMSLRDSWKETGVGLGHAFRDLGKTLVKTVKTGAEKVDNWANSDEDQPSDDSDNRAE